MYPWIVRHYLKVMSFVHHDITLIIGWAFLAVRADLDPRLHGLQPLQEGELEQVFVLLPYDLLLCQPTQKLSIITMHHRKYNNIVW